jgi:hypothetical protein
LHAGFKVPSAHFGLSGLVGEEDTVVIADLLELIVADDCVVGYGEGVQFGRVFRDDHLAEIKGNNVLGT